MKVRFHPAALKESVEAGSYYDRQHPGLGKKFDEAIRSAIAAIVEAPQRWPLRTKGTRRYHVKRFPYIIVYTVLDETVIIVAVMHARRRPGYWADRL